MAKLIRCKVTDEYVQGAGVVIGAAGSHNDVTIELAFSEIWEDTTKQVVWHNALGQNPTIILLTLDMRTEEGSYLVSVPFEAKEIEGDCSMTVKGAKTDGKVETFATLTTTAYFRVLPSAWDANAEESEDLTPSQAVLIQNQIDVLLEKIDKAVEAGEAADEAIAAKDAAVTAAGSAQASADSADKAAQKAADDARDAIADEMTGYVTAAQTAQRGAEASATAASAAQKAAEKARDEAQGIVGGDYATKEALEKGLAGKADLVDGKVPAYQLPEIGGGTADEITVTPETAELFGLGEDATVDDTLAKLSEAAFVKKIPQYTQVSLGGLAEGSIIQLNENGSPVDFYVAKHNYESGLNGEGRTLLLRKSCYDRRSWNSTPVSTYATSTIDAWLNEDYKSVLDEDIQSQIGETKFYYTVGGGNHTVTTLSRPVFLLSVTEMGLTADYANVEGSVLPNVAALQVADYNGNGTAVQYWTRTPEISSGNTNARYISPSRETGGLNASTGQAYSRPSFTLPSTYGEFIVDASGAIVPEQVYDTTMTDLNGTPVGTRIETGSYVGTGTYGADNPCTLTFGFEPKLIYIYPSGVVAGGGHGSSSQYTSDYIWGIHTSEQSKRFGKYTSSKASDITTYFTWRKTLSWYSATLASGTPTGIIQCNESGKTYNYVAIG